MHNDANVRLLLNQVGQNPCPAKEPQSIHFTLQRLKRLKSRDRRIWMENALEVGKDNPHSAKMLCFTSLYVYPVLIYKSSFRFIASCPTNPKAISINLWRK